MECFFCLLFNNQGLKTGMYYLRTKPAVNAIQFTVDKTKLAASVAPVKKTQEQNEAAIACSINNREECLMCSG